ncbi:polygalacturonase inhibitor 1-like protein [Carex littledalei]|uniref:Polygalacturonase inhibitor 1-like protein n=1 Tax=Carex littledalei TaxID=544730 RepID=A0A833V027_9POAL|nr:polygalacturonase inhibitor 1-like protein [Carex littledalei]
MAMCQIQLKVLPGCGISICHSIDFVESYLRLVTCGNSMPQFFFANNTCLCGNPLPPCFNSAPAPMPVSTTQFDSAPTPAPAPVSTTLFELVPPPNSGDDEKNILLKMKEQLDNPEILRRWVKDDDYCGGFTYEYDSHVVVLCTDTGRVSDLIIRNLDVYAPFPDAICEFTELERLEIAHLPGLHCLIPSCISQHVKLGSLFTSKTSISGYVPYFSNNTNLYYIALSSNQLSGTIPQSLSTLPKLRSLDLGSNYLTGTIPKSYGSGNLFMIRVRNNLLSGDASFLFGKQMNDMELANNDFEFGPSFVEFSDKQHNLDLSHNKIYGNVPDSIASSDLLWNLNLSFNRLCGELPKSGNMGRFNAAVFANNTCLCGNPLPPCFNLAPAPTPESTTPQVPL